MNIFHSLVVWSVVVLASTTVGRADDTDRTEDLTEAVDVAVADSLSASTELALSRFEGWARKTSGPGAEPNARNRDLILRIRMVRNRPQFGAADTTKVVADLTRDIQSLVDGLNGQREALRIQTAKYERVLKELYGPEVFERRRRFREYDTHVHASRDKVLSLQETVQTWRRLLSEAPQDAVPRFQNTLSQVEQDLATAQADLQKIEAGRVDLGSPPPATGARAQAAEAKYDLLVALEAKVGAALEVTEIDLGDAKPLGARGLLEHVKALK